jgi:uncharacterized cupin superfamily protein
MKIILDEEVRKGTLRADRAWELFFESKSSLIRGPGLAAFANWLWDELGRYAGNLNRDSKGEVTVTVPSLKPDALDFLLRLVSFWADEVYLKKGGTMSENLWRKPVVNVFDDQARDGAERTLIGAMDEVGSIELNLMPLLGPGRAFFSVQVIEKDESTARFHSHSALDEYYLILDGKGTLRYNGMEMEVKRGDLIGKPIGPDAATQLIADRGERLRILDMEVWHERQWYSKDLMLTPDFNEIIMRGPGWGAIIPRESLIPSEEYRSHYGEGYRRTKDGGWVSSQAHGHKKVRGKDKTLPKKGQRRL